MALQMSDLWVEFWLCRACRQSFVAQPEMFHAFCKLLPGVGLNSTLILGCERCGRISAYGAMDLPIPRSLDLITSVGTHARIDQVFRLEISCEEQKCNSRIFVWLPSGVLSDPLRAGKYFARAGKVDSSVRCKRLHKARTPIDVCGVSNT